ncbi:MAG: type II toxin-antitoxin system VapB family antitoxin, partial [Ornithinimicrobium sp.]|jgi:antitoxin VapB|uniref:type II toxin-antitoxin system VapB family antitoxin n=1 Tax=Ornithinimicrobium sp. TaxID=1977084 RepID=UPI003D9BB5F4
MALSIKTTEADRLARELAAATHESITEAVTAALRERLDRVRQDRAADEQLFRAELQALAARAEAAERRGVGDVLEWDQDGLPR